MSSAKHVDYPNPNLPRKGEVPLKCWLEQRGAELGITAQAYYNRLDRGRVPWPKLRRVNKRVVYVKNGGAS